MVRATAGVALARRLLSGAAATLLFSCSQAACGQVPAKSPGAAHSSRSVRGILVSRAGLPVSNAMVAVVGHSIWDGIKTDRQGRFEVKQVPSDAKAVLAYSQRSDRMAVIPTSPWPAGEQVYVLDCDAVQVVGRVVDRDRRAVQGALATFHVTAPGGISYSAEVYEKTRTDGEILSDHLPAASGWTVRASLPSGESTPAISILGPTTAVLPDLVQKAAANPAGQPLAPLVKYSGRFVDEQGKPISGVRLIIFSTTEGSNVQYRAATDADGRWSLNFPADLERLNIRPDHPDFVGYEFSFSRLQSPPGRAFRDGSAVQVLVRGLRVTGVVRDRTGAPVVNALVLAGLYSGRTAEGEPLEESTSARTSSDGTFSIGGIPKGSHDLLVVADGFAPTNAKIMVLPGMASVEIPMDPGRTVGGRIVDDARKPLAGVTISAGSWRLPGSPHFPLTQNVKSGADGRFVLRELPSEGIVSATAYGKNRLPIGFAIDAASDDAGNIPLARYPVIEGKVVDAETGEAVRKFGVTPEWQFSGLKKPSPLRLEERVETKDGVFRREIKYVIIDQAKPSQFFVKISAPGYAAASTPPVEPGKKYEPFLIKLKRASALSGRIVTPDDHLAAQAQVCFVGPENDAGVSGTTVADRYLYTPDLRTMSDAGGRFELASPGKSGRVLILHPAGYAIVPADTLRREQGLKLTAWARLEGTYRPGGKPRADVRVIVQAFRPKAELLSKDRLWFELSTTTDASGRFVIEHVPASQLVVAAWAGFGPAAEKTIRFEAGKTTHVDLGVDGPPVDGRVDLRPVIEANPPEPGLSFDTSNSWVRAFRIEPRPELPSGVDAADWNHQWQLVLEGKAGEALTIPARFADLKPDGSFRFEALPAGRYVVLVGIHGRRPPETCGWGVMLAKGRADFAVGNQPVMLPEIESKTTLHPQIGSFAPSVAWKTAKGEPMTLSSLRGKYVVLDFWAGWCAPCMAAQSSLKILYERNKNRATFIGLNFDYTEGNARAALELIKTPWSQVLAGAWDSNNPTLVQYGIEVIPSIWLIDEEGRIVAKDLTPDQLAQALAELPRQK